MSIFYRTILVCYRNYNTVSTPLLNYILKKCQTLDFDCPNEVQNPIKLDIDKCVTN